jgi:hypothetical protein
MSSKLQACGMLHTVGRESIYCSLPLPSADSVSLRKQCHNVCGVRSASKRGEVESKFSRVRNFSFVVLFHLLKSEMPTTGQ